MSIWDELGIAPSGDPAGIRQAYARRLKQVHPEDDPEGFQSLLAERAIDAFGWDRDTSHLSPEASTIAWEIVARREALERLTTLRRAARRPRYLALFLFDRLPLAAAVLLGPYRPRLFSLLSLDRGTFNAVSALLSELAFYFPGRAECALDPST